MTTNNDKALHIGKVLMALGSPCGTTEATDGQA